MKFNTEILKRTKKIETVNYKKGGKTKEPTIVRGFSDDEPYEYKKGGNITYKGITITKEFPSGYFTYYSDKNGRFLKADTLDGLKKQINKENKMAKGGKMAKSKEIELNADFFKKLSDAEMNFMKDNGKEYNRLLAIKYKVEEEKYANKKMNNGGELTTWENILLKYGFKKLRSRYGVTFYKKHNYSASIYEKGRNVEIYFLDEVIYNGYSIREFNNTLADEFGGQKMANGGELNSCNYSIGGL